MIDRPPPTYGPLSPKMQERLPDLLHAHRASLQQADDDAHVPHDFLVLRFGQNLDQLQGALKG